MSRLSCCSPRPLHMSNGHQYPNHPPPSAGHPRCQDVQLVAVSLSPWPPNKDDFSGLQDKIGDRWTLSICVAQELWTVLTLP